MIGLSVEWSAVVYQAIVKAGAVTLLHKEAAGEELYPLIQTILPLPA